VRQVSEELFKSLDKREKWYNKVALCLKCDWASGEILPEDKCLKYNMPFYMCGRKKRCNHITNVKREVSKMKCRKKDNGNWELTPERPSETLFLHDLMEGKIEGVKRIEEDQAKGGEGAE
jgi:hypothetical protein